MTYWNHYWKLWAAPLGFKRRLTWITLHSLALLILIITVPSVTGAWIVLLLIGYGLVKITTRAFEWVWEAIGS